jgi:hypothetical protein
MNRMKVAPKKVRENLLAHDFLRCQMYPLCDRRPRRETDHELKTGLARCLFFGVR